MIRLPPSNSSKNNESEYIHSLSIIIDRYMSSLTENQCLLVIPVTLFFELESIKNDVQDAIDIFPSPSNNQNNSELPHTIPIVPIDAIDILKDRDTEVSPVIYVPDSFNLNVVSTRKFSDGCYTCSGKIIDVDFSVNFIDTISNGSIKFTTIYEGLNRSPNPYMCNIAGMFSYVCVPDLLGIISLLLLQVAKIISGISFSSFSILSMIRGIVTVVLRLVLGKISVVATVTTPKVYCILNAIEEIISALPTTYNISRGVGQDTLDKFGIDARNSIDYARYVDIAKGKVGNYTMQANDAISTIMVGLSDAINGAVDSIEDWIAQLLNFKNYITCEEERSGASVSNDLTRLMDLIDLINLLKAIIAYKLAKEECNGEDVYSDKDKDDPYSSGGNGGNNGGYQASIVDIANIVGNTWGLDFGIVNSSDGVVQLFSTGIRPVPGHLLSIYDCGFNRFIETVNDIEEYKIPDLKITIPEVTIGSHPSSGSAIDLSITSLEERTDPDTPIVITYSQSADNIIASAMQALIQNIGLTTAEEAESNKNTNTTKLELPTILNANSFEVASREITNNMDDGLLLECNKLGDYLK
jgi:hypothetical protein